MRFVITRHAKQRAKQRFGRDFNLAASVNHARPLTSGEYKRERARSRRSNGITLPKREELLIDPQHEAIFVIAPSKGGTTRTVLTVVKANPPKVRRGTKYQKR